MLKVSTKEATGDLDLAYKWARFVGLEGYGLVPDFVVTPTMSSRVDQVVTVVKPQELESRSQHNR